jgi:hypothetical protein
MENPKIKAEAMDSIMLKVVEIFKDYSIQSLDELDEKDFEYLAVTSDIGKETMKIIDKLLIDMKIVSK